MGVSTGIEWTDSTWNPVSGCSKVSQGCKHCYAERVFPRPYPGRAFTDVRVHENRLLQPIWWAKGRRIFVNSMSDLFHESVPFEFIAKVFAVMACTTRHTYQVLTKRPERMVEFFEWLHAEGDEDYRAIDAASDASSDNTLLRQMASFFWPAQVQPSEVFSDWLPQHNPRRGGYDNCGPLWPLVNVWLGVSIENQETANVRIPRLLQVPAAVRFLSCEPLLGHIDLTQICPREWSSIRIDALEGQERIDGLAPIKHPRIDWVICGGESGPRARAMHPDWARSLRDQCVAAGVPFFFKQWGLARPGKKKAGRELDGRTWNEFPNHEGR